ncbi:MAG TPA: thiamine pyrophosphate-dependent enzyme [Candidatus Methanofastidiosa archaeon]|nr:thiamine pyrophosphate-dependent enzyme [Candidatus Methanofastidiosa archaeon]
MISNQEIFDKYIRKNMMPTILCSGCGNGIVLNSILRAIDELGKDIDKMVFVSGIGCSSRLNSYIKADGLHTTHGRPIAFATGIKAANPDLDVVVFTGDGDCAGIGGNHFIHGIRRNIDLTVIALNNYNYGMTGGQASPTTPYESITTTTQYESFEHPFDLSKLAMAAGAPFVARWTMAHPLQLLKTIKKGLAVKGFSFIEVLTACPTSYWRKNHIRDTESMYRWYKENTVSAKRSENEPEKIVIGELQHLDKKEWTEQWTELVERVSL